MIFLRLQGLLAGLALCLPAWSQAEVKGDFTAASAPGWSLAGVAAPTAPSLDPAGAGWLRLTGNAPGALGSALYTGGTFNAAAGLTLSFSYAAWGGGEPGGDGIAVFLYDASRDMAGTSPGGGMGYCNGNGAWLGLALDEYGNFSHPADRCGNGPGPRPQSLVLRGPATAQNPYIGQAAVPGKIDRPAATRRPPAAHVTMHLRPKPSGPGYTATVEWRAEGSASWTRLLDRVDFPHAAPAALRVGVAASTGAAKNIHEVRHLSVRAHTPATVSQGFDPAVVSRGVATKLTLRLGSRDDEAARLIEQFTHKLPAGLQVANPAALGGTCPGMVTAAPGGSTITLAPGTLVRAGGCTVTVSVMPEATGVLTSIVPTGSIVTDAGANVAPAAAALTVRP